MPYDQWPQTLKDEYAYNLTGAKALLAAASYPDIYTDIVADASADQFVTNSPVRLGGRRYYHGYTAMDPVAWNNYVRVQKKYDQLAYRSNGSLGFTFEPTTQLTQFIRELQVTIWGLVTLVLTSSTPKLWQLPV